MRFLLCSLLALAAFNPGTAHAQDAMCDSISRVVASSSTRFSDLLGSPAIVQLQTTSIYPALVALPGADECVVTTAETYGMYECTFDTPAGAEASQGEALVRRVAACFTPSPSVVQTRHGGWEFEISNAKVSGGADGSGRAGRVVFHVSTGLE